MSVPPVLWVHPDIRRSWIFGSCRHRGGAPDTKGKRGRLRGLNGPALTLCLLLLAASCADRQDRLRTFADHPGFKTLEGCRDGKPGRLPDLQEQELLARYRPRLFAPPGGAWPIDFYRDYLPSTVLRDHARGGAILHNRVTRKLLQEVAGNPTVYLDLVREPPLRKGADPPFRSVLYGRAYRGKVEFRDEGGRVHVLPLTFLKYNATFARSGLPARLPWGYESGVRLLGLDPEDWHHLDHFCAIHVVLDEEERPVAALVAQHNHHRTYLIGKDLLLPEDGRLAFAIARRSNELYPDDGSPEPARHRVAPWALYFRYLLSGMEAPFFRGEDLTYGRKAGGVEVVYELKFLLDCDPYYRSGIMLGRYRPFLGRNIGRNGPPGADYYALPSLLSLGNLLRFSYLHDSDPADIRAVEENIDVKRKTIHIQGLIERCGARLYRDLLAARGKR